jgi:hypothetical protein
MFQGSSIELKFKPASIANSSATFQIDGEPFVTPLGIIHCIIYRRYCFTVFLRRKSCRHADFKVYNASMVGFFAEFLCRTSNLTDYFI